MGRKRITISLSSKNDDAVTVAQALEQVAHWKRSAELVRWAAAYLNGKALTQIAPLPELDLIQKEYDDALDAW